jgi:aminoglycoside/choline kinase family phosphotransferase
MSAPKPVISNAFESSASDRLARFIAQQGIASKEVIPLTPDASTRKYYRIGWKKRTASPPSIQEPFDPEFHPYLDVTRLFLECDIPVPEIYAVDGAAGIIVQEDLGDGSCFRFTRRTGRQCDEYKEQAIALIAKIQKATDKAYEMNSIASRLAFDEAKLSWELDFFFEHYFTSCAAEKLRHAEVAEVKAELNDIAAELSAAPRVLCHRDYHAANLMIDKESACESSIIRTRAWGPASYDLVSFLLDRQPCPPSLAELRGHRLFFLEERRCLGSGDRPRRFCA